MPPSSTAIAPTMISGPMALRGRRHQARTPAMVQIQNTHVKMKTASATSGIVRPTPIWMSPISSASAEIAHSARSRAPIDQPRSRAGLE